MSAITYWSRLEPRPRSHNFQRGLAATVHDPLWLLLRQWQFGEFNADDAGSLVHGEMKWSSRRLRRFAGKDLNEFTAFENNTPLETVIEREESFPSLKLAVELGQNFERMLVDGGFAQYLEEFRRKYPLRLVSEEWGDADTQRYFKFMQGRAMDGFKFNAELADSLPSALPAVLSIDASHTDSIKTIAQEFHEMSRSMFSMPSTDEPECWRPERLEYQFSISAPSIDTPNQSVLVSSEYSDGSLDWYSFSFDPNAQIGSDIPLESDDKTNEVSTFLPTNIRFKGMPNRRWWEFEDETINFGAIDADRKDIAKLIVMDFALNSSDDWYVIPLILPVGSISRVNSLIVTDVFGERILIRPVEQTLEQRQETWSMFKISDKSHSLKVADFLFLPPSVGFLQESPSIERINFIRDEMANFVWAIEQIYENQLGEPVSGYEYSGKLIEEGVGDENGPSTENKVIYKIQSLVPRNWIPFLPVQIPGGNRAIDLQLGTILNSESNGADTNSPRGKILNPTGVDPYLIKEEEITRAGVFVSRSLQLARWIDGSTHLWIGRRKSMGRGEGSSGLRFDIIS